MELHVLTRIARTVFRICSVERELAQEILAGFTTFMTMAYIVFVNPAILHEAGMPLAAVTAATCLAAAGRTEALSTERSGLGS